jgi:ADP-ribose pyrophosphatase
MEIYHGKRLWIEKRNIRLPNGHEREKLIVHPGDAVAILPREEGRCKLLMQYRAAIGQYIIEAPAGAMEAGESPADTAHRELIEETGFAAGTMIPRGFIYTTPGFTDEKLFLFEARDLTPSELYEKDKDEIIEVFDCADADLFAMIHDGAIIDAKTICLIQRCIRCR